MVIKKPSIVIIEAGMDGSHCCQQALQNLLSCVVKGGICVVKLRICCYTRWIVSEGRNRNQLQREKVFEVGYKFWAMIDLVDISVVVPELPSKDVNGFPGCNF